MSEYDSGDEYHSDDESNQFNTCDEEIQDEEHGDDNYRGDWFKHDRDMIYERVEDYLSAGLGCSISKEEVVELFGKVCLDAFKNKNRRIIYKGKKTNLGYEMMFKIMLSWYYKPVHYGVPSNIFKKGSREHKQFNSFILSVRKSVAFHIMRLGSVCSENNIHREGESADARIIREYGDDIRTGKRGLYHYEYTGDDNKTHFKYFTLAEGAFERFMAICPDDMRRIHQKVLADTGGQICRFDIEKVFRSIREGHEARDMLEANLLRLCMQAINEVCHQHVNNEFKTVKFKLYGECVTSLADLMTRINNLSPHQQNVKNISNSHIAFAQCHREDQNGCYKVSFHVHMPKIIMLDKILIACCNRLSKLICNLLDITELIVDTGIYGHKKSLRCPFSHKTGKPDAIMMPYQSRELSLFEMTYDQKNMNPFDRFVIGSFYLDKNACPTAIYPEYFNEDEVYGNSIDYTSNFNAPSDLQAFRVALDIFLKDRPYLKSEYTIEKTHIHIERKQAAECKDCNRVHDKLGAIVKQRGDGYAAICEAAYWSSNKANKKWHSLDIAAPIREVVKDNTIIFAVSNIEQYVKAYIEKYPGQYCEHIRVISERSARCDSITGVPCHKCNIVHTRGCYLSISYDAKSSSVFVRRVSPCEQKPKAEFLCSVANGVAYTKAKSGFDLESAVYEICDNNDNNLFQLNPRDHAGFYVIKRNEQYISSIPCDSRMMVIKSAKGTGKSHAMVRMFKQLCERDDRFRILLITHRVSFGLALRSEIEKEGIQCSFYQDSDEEHLTMNMGVNIVQVDSLRRISRELRSCSMVVLDEIQSIISKVKDFDDVRRSASLRVLQRAMTETERVLIMDANITDQLMRHVINPALIIQGRHLTEKHEAERGDYSYRIRLMSELMLEIGCNDLDELNRLKKEQKRLVRSSNEPIQHNEPYIMVNSYLPLKEQEYKAHITNNIGRLYRMIFKDLDEKKRIAVASSSKNKLIRLESAIKSRYPTLKVLLISGDMSDIDKRYIFNDVDTVFSRYDVLLYSPSVSSGISFNKPHFARLYVIYTKGGMNTLDCSQQMHRIRQLAEKNIVIYMNVASVCDKGVIPSVRDLEKRHIDDINARVMPMGVVVEGSFITRIHAYNDYIHTISTRRMLECIVNLLENDGINVDVITDINKDDNTMTKQSKAKSGEQLAKYLEELNKAERYVEFQYVDAVKHIGADKMMRVRKSEEYVKKIGDMKDKITESPDCEYRKRLDELEAQYRNEILTGIEYHRNTKLAIENYAIRSYINAACDIKQIDASAYKLYENPTINKAITAYRWYRGMALDDIRDYDFTRMIGKSTDFDSCGHLVHPVDDINTAWKGYEHYKQKHYANRDEYNLAWKRFHMMKRASRSYGRLIDVENTDVARFTARRIYVAGCLLKMLGFDGDNAAARKAIDFNSHAKDIERYVDEYNKNASQLDRIEEDSARDMFADRKNKRKVNDILTKCFNMRFNEAEGVCWLEWIAGKDDELILNIDTLEFVKVGQVASEARIVKVLKQEAAVKRNDEFGDKNYIAVPNGEGFFYIKSKNGKKGKNDGEMMKSSVTTHKNKYPELRDLYEQKTNVEKLKYKNTE